MVVIQHYVGSVESSRVFFFNKKRTEQGENLEKTSPRSEHSNLSLKETRLKRNFDLMNDFPILVNTLKNKEELSSLFPVTSKFDSAICYLISGSNILSSCALSFPFLLAVVSASMCFF
jgi:hypothetical protein